MKKIFTLYLILGFLFPSITSAQQKDTHVNNNIFIWDFISMGVRHEFYTPDNELVSKLYMEPEKSLLHWQYVSFDYIFYNNFGINYGLDIYKKGSNIEVPDELNYQISQKYPGYFIHDYYHNLIDEEKNSLFSGSSQRFGISYLQQHARLYIIYRLSVKMIPQEYKFYTAILKQENTNRYLKISYLPETAKRNKWALNPSVNFKYKIGKGVFTKIDFAYLFYKPGISYNFTETDLFTGDVLQNNKIECNHSIHQLYIDVGLGFIF